LLGGRRGGALTSNTSDTTLAGSLSPGCAGTTRGGGGREGGHGQPSAKRVGTMTEEGAATTTTGKMKGLIGGAFHSLPYSLLMTLRRGTIASAAASAAAPQSRSAKARGAVDGEGLKPSTTSVTTATSSHRDGGRGRLAPCRTARPRVPGTPQARR